MKEGFEILEFLHSLFRSLADMNNDGKMDKKEFSIAMHLIKKKLQGYELPKSLPHTLKTDPSPVIGSFGTMPQPTGMVPMGPQMGRLFLYKNCSICRPVCVVTQAL